ncbi:MAG: hypothetical protein KDD82_05380, partial [Planctomycetes bacterium]|nr:hypothetical protein [Planctomycetota bacterium]
MSPRPDDDEAPRRKPGRSGPEPDPAKFPFGESLNPNAAGADRARFPFGDTLDESDEAALGVPGASTTGDEEEELVSAEDLDEPTLRALGLAGSKSSDYLDSDLGALVDSDLGALDTSGDVIRDTGEYDPEDEIFDSSSSLPNVPPGSTPDDDASLAGIASGTGALDDDDDDPMFTPSELGRVSDMGAIGPSGPLVIVDDEAQSTRFSASVAGDDSVRLAGARSARRPGQRGARRPPKEPAPPPSEDFEASWDDGDLDVDVPVPTVSARKPPARDTPRGKEPRKGTGKEPRKGTGKEPRKATGKEPRKATGKGKRETRATGAQSRVASGRARRPGRDS